jgi:hypothetical protein
MFSAAYHGGDDEGNCVRLRIEKEYGVRGEVVNIDLINSNRLLLNRHTLKNIKDRTSTYLWTKSCSLSPQGVCDLCFAIVKVTAINSIVL